MTSDRRRFLRRAAGGLFAGSLAGSSGVLAQARSKPWLIGYLSPRATRSEADDAFIRAMDELGYRSGRNLRIEFRWAGNDANRLQAMADELVRLDIDVLVTATTAGTRSAMRATRTIPIVMAAASDPVAAGLVASLGKPGGNVTGMSLQTLDMARKRLHQMREIVPGATRIAVLAQSVTPDQGTTEMFLTETRAAAKQMGVGLVIREIAHADELAEAFAQFRREQAHALIVQVGPLTLEHRRRITELAAGGRLPAMYEVRNFVDDGGFVSYGPDLRESYRRAAAYVDRILKGARPEELPVQQPDKLALIINLRAAKELGVTVPQAALLRADELIQ